MSESFLFLLCLNLSVICLYLLVAFLHAVKKPIHENSSFPDKQGLSLSIQILCVILAIIIVAIFYAAVGIRSDTCRIMECAYSGSTTIRLGFMTVSGYTHDYITLVNETITWVSTCATKPLASPETEHYSMGKRVPCYRSGYNVYLSLTDLYYGEGGDIGVMYLIFVVVMLSISYWLRHLSRRPVF